MQSGNVVLFVWPEVSNTVSIIALALALAVFVFGAFTGLVTMHDLLIVAIG
jgi:hypothetical protein